MNHERAGRERESGAAGERGSDWARFLGTWVRHPITIGSVAPSSPDYCARMVACSTTGVAGPVLELGPGLGVITRALLEAGVAPERITSVEFDPAFAATLKRRFPRVNVICGDGFDLDRTLGDARDTRFATILLAIPIVRFGQGERARLVGDYLSRLRPGGNLTQLSYLWTPPVKPVAGLFAVTHSPVVWNNLPPARVWIYTPAAGAGTAAARDGRA